MLVIWRILFSIVALYLQKGDHCDARDPHSGAWFEEVVCGVRVYRRDASAEDSLPRQYSVQFEGWVAIHPAVRTFFCWNKLRLDELGIRHMDVYWNLREATFRCWLNSRPHGVCYPHEFVFLHCRRVTGRTALKFCVAYGASISQLLANKWPGQVRSQSCEIRDTASDRFFNEVVFPAT